jgi:predicted ribosome quality control (RQC) complex YloA/Tae2 family protein
MHSSFFFLQKLSNELNDELRAFSIVSCFSQDKDELVIELNNRAKSLFIKAHLHSDFCCLSFPTSFARARKNSVDLFSEILMKEVVSVRQFQNERSFAFMLQDGLALLFKMHGNRANVVLFQNERATAIFRNHLKPDLEIKLDSLDRHLEWTYPYFLEHQSDLKKRFFTLGNEAWEYLNNQGFQTLKTEQQWDLLHDLHEQLTNGKFFIIKKEKGIFLSLFPQGEILQEHFNAIKAINEFFLLKMKTGFADNGKVEGLKAILEKEKQTIRYIEKNKALLQSLQHDQQYQLWADLIMANLYSEPQDKGNKRLEKIILKNYKDEGKPVEIKLKKELSLQKNAEEYYRKAKNQKIEIEKLSESIQQKEVELAELIAAKEKLNSGENIPSSKSKAASKNKEVVRLPYKEIEFKGFLIRIGKSAKDNDELTLKYAHKEDLWLHAKDVSGSHVVVKHQSGKVFPKDVIERAAELAALNSKRKGESLCPVAVTTKKFVRKRKGDPAGLVVVEREKVVMVVPR